jgi:hypothetical protein
MCGHVGYYRRALSTVMATRACVTHTDYIRSTLLNYQGPAMDHRYYDRCQAVELTEYSHALSRNEGTRSTRQELCRTPSCIRSDRTRKTLCFCLKVSSGPRSAGISHPDASAELQELPALNTLGASGRQPPVLVGVTGRTHISAYEFDERIHYSPCRTGPRHRRGCGPWSSAKYQSCLNSIHPYSARVTSLVPR